MGYWETVHSEILNESSNSYKPTYSNGLYNNTALLDEAFNDLVTMDQSYFATQHIMMLDEAEGGGNSWWFESSTNNMFTTMGKWISSPFRWLLSFDSMKGIRQWLGVGGNDQHTYEKEVKWSPDKFKSEATRISKLPEGDRKKAIDELPSDVKSQITSAIGDDGKKALASDFKFTEVTIKQQMTDMMGKISKLGGYIKDNPQAVTYTALAGVGLLGAFYLAKKFLSKKKENKEKDERATQKDLAYAAALDQATVAQIKAKGGDQKVFVA